MDILQDINRCLSDFNECFNLVNTKESKDIIPQKYVSLTRCFGVELKSGCCFFNYTDEYLLYDKNPTENYIKHYEKVAKTGVSLVFTGGVLIDSNSKKNPQQRPFFDEDFKIVNKYKEVTDKVHTFGVKIFNTLKPNLGRQNGYNKFLNMMNYSSSFNRNYLDSRVICARISDLKCSNMIDEMIGVAKNSILGGFDGLLIDGSMNNILGEMSSIEFNRRIFGYYSAIEELPVKIVKSILSVCGIIPIVYKITFYTFIKEVYGENWSKILSLKHIKIEDNLKQVIHLIESLIEAGVDGFIFEFGIKETEFIHNHAFNINNTMFVKIYNYISAYLSGKKTKNKYSEDVVFIFQGIPQEDDISGVTMIDITRNLISDNNYLRNQKTQILSKNCIKCCKCNDLCEKCADFDCTVNEFDKNRSIIQHFQYQKEKVCVVGAGVSGIVCANELAKRNIAVDLYEEKGSINNTGTILEIFGFDNDMKNYNNYICEKLNEFSKLNKVSIFLNKKFTIQSIDLNKYSAIIIATGFMIKELCIAGAVLKNVKNLYEINSAKNIHFNKKSVVVYAKTEFSLKYALYLKSINKDVVVITKGYDCFLSMPNAKMTYYLYMFNKLKVGVFVDSFVKKIHDDFCEVVVNRKLKNKNLSAVVLNIKSSSSYGYLPQTINIDYDLFVYEPEITPNNKSFYDIVSSGYTGEVYMIGEALKVGDLYSDIKSAFFVGKNI